MTNSSDGSVFERDPSDGHTIPSSLRNRNWIRSTEIPTECQYQHDGSNVKRETSGTMVALRRSHYSPFIMKQKLDPRRVANAIVSRRRRERVDIPGRASKIISTPVDRRDGRSCEKRLGSRNVQMVEMAEPRRRPESRNVAVAEPRRRPESRNVTVAEPRRRRTNSSNR